MCLENAPSVEVVRDVLYVLKQAHESESYACRSRIEHAPIRHKDVPPHLQVPAPAVRVLPFSHSCSNAAVRLCTQVYHCKCILHGQCQAVSGSQVHQ
jgi:hypothetical protein